ncbi:MAG: hypothetical protein HYU76_06485 [Betaproteobacteria bacterium]|nr:hypothetical protein [Betaproteobacteria bacterium]
MGSPVVCGRSGGIRGLHHRSRDHAAPIERLVHRARRGGQVRDGFTGLERPGQRYSVTAVSGERVQVSVSRDGLNDELQVYDRQWNWLKRPATNLQSFDYSPPYQAFAFPLAPGKTWRARLTATDPADGRRFPVTIHGEVLGWERVKVPAGEFDSLKVRRNVFFDYWEHTVRGRSEIVETEWYAPAAKQAVRRETTSQYWSYLYGERDTGFLRVRGSDRDGGGPRFVQDDWLIYELISHSVR